MSKPDLVERLRMRAEAAEACCEARARENIALRAQLAQLVEAARRAYDADEVCYLNAVLAEIDSSDKENK